MDAKLRNAVIKAMDTAPNEPLLGEYFAKLAKQLAPPKYAAKTINLREAMYRLIDDDLPKFRLELKSPEFEGLNNFFFLTAGLHIIGAQSGHGKTFWAMQWAKEAAKQGMNVLFLSLEMSPEDLSARELSSISDLPLMHLLKREMDEQQKLVLKGVIGSEDYDYLERIHIEIFGDYDWVKIQPRLMDRMSHLKPKLIIVDYIQMISHSEMDDRLSKVLSDISRELKLFADENDSAALVLSQLNRESKKESDRLKDEDLPFIPFSHDHIKESGGIVEAADSVQIVCIPGKLMNCPEHLKNKFQVSISKSRRLGELGSKLLNFDSGKMRFK